MFSENSVSGGSSEADSKTSDVVGDKAGSENSSSVDEKFIFTKKVRVREGHTSNRMESSAMSDSSATETKDIDDGESALSVDIMIEHSSSTSKSNTTSSSRVGSVITVGKSYSSGDDASKSNSVEESEHLGCESIDADSGTEKASDCTASDKSEDSGAVMEEVSIAEERT